MDRRRFLQAGAAGLLGTALPGALPVRLDPGLHHPARAKRVIWLFQSGGPSQMDLFDHKPELKRLHGQELPDSVRRGQRLTGMSGHQATLPLVASPFEFERHGECGAWVSSLLPHTARLADRLCFIRSMYTEAINHDPAITFVQTGSPIAGRPSIGAWLSHGLGPANPNLPATVAMVSRDKGGQPLYARLWGAGFLPAKHQGVQFRPGRDAVLYLSNPDGVTRRTRRRMLDSLRELHALQRDREGDPLLDAHTDRYEMAYRMQESIPEVTDLRDEPDEVFELYGKDSRKPGTYAANCLLARRLAERDVRFIQLFHQGWDQHGSLPGGLTTQCRETDQASAALVTDLERRGLLDDTLIVWTGEFGRTSYCQGKLTKNGFGRDHHPRCWTLWMAGGGARPGLTWGETDELGYNVVRDPVHVHDLQATVLHLLGIDHERLTYKYQGRRYRLTDVHGQVVKGVIA